MSPNQMMDHLLTGTEQGGHGMDDYTLRPEEGRDLSTIHMRDHYENNGWLEHPNHEG